jgi:hypothetical protein
MVLQLTKSRRRLPLPLRLRMIWSLCCNLQLLYVSSTGWWDMLSRYDIQPCIELAIAKDEIMFIMLSILNTIETGLFFYYGWSSWFRIYDQKF